MIVLSVLNVLSVLLLGVVIVEMIFAFARNDLKLIIMLGTLAIVNGFGYATLYAQSTIIKTNKLL